MTLRIFSDDVDGYKRAEVFWRSRSLLCLRVGKLQTRPVLTVKDGIDELAYYHTVRRIL